LRRSTLNHDVAGERLVAPTEGQISSNLIWKQKGKVLWRVSNFSNFPMKRSNRSESDGEAPDEEEEEELELELELEVESVKEEKEEKEEPKKVKRQRQREKKGRKEKTKKKEEELEFDEFKLRRIIKENHGKPINQIAFNPEPINHNLVATVADNQVSFLLPFF